MKRIFTLIFILILLLSSTGCQADRQKTDDILCAETWHNLQGNTFTFYNTGSGKITGRETESYFTWETGENNTIHISYEISDTSPIDYKVEKVNDAYRLISSYTNTYYLRESEFDSDPDFLAVRILTSDNWINYLGTVNTFYSDGTGYADGTPPIDFTWEYLGNNIIRMKYTFIGTMTVSDFTLEHVDGMYSLSFVGNDTFFVRVSDYTSSTFDS